MNLAELVRRLGAAGCTNDQIAVAIECFQEIGKERRAKAAAHMRDVRSRERTLAHVTNIPPTYKSPLKKDVCKPDGLHTSVRARPLPADWTLDAEGRAYAQQKHGWNEHHIDEEAERFRLHALSSGRRQVDWQASWRKWVMSPYQQKGNGNGQGQSKSVLEAGRRIDAKLKAMGATDDYVPGTSGPKPLDLDQLPRPSDLRRLPPR